MMSVTIKDIANIAGVSYSTVSKALNDSPLVKHETKKKIVRIAKEMGYTPNYAAQKLVLKQTKVIGLIWPTVERAVLSTLVTKISQEIHKTPYSMILSVDPIQQSIETFRRFQVDGMIIFEENIDETIDNLRIPILSYGVAKDRILHYPVIDANHEEAMYQAISHLYQLGHQRIAYIGDLSRNDALQKAKINGFIKAMHAYGLPVHHDWVIDTHGLDWYDGYTATNKLLRKTLQPTAIVGGSYDISGGIIRAVKERNLQIPDDISIISYDNVPQMNNMEVPLTCIGVPIDELATEIVNAMIKIIENNQEEIFVKKMTPVLVKRNSTIAIK